MDPVLILDILDTLTQSVTLIPGSADVLSTVRTVRYPLLT